MKKQAKHEYLIMTGKDIDMDDVLRQLCSVREFPATIQITKTILATVDHAADLWALRSGLEIGWNLALDKFYDKEDRPANVPLSQKPAKDTTAVIVQVAGDQALTASDFEAASRKLRIAVGGTEVDIEDMVGVRCWTVRGEQSEIDVMTAMLGSAGFIVSDNNKTLPTDKNKLIDAEKKALMELLDTIQSSPLQAHDALREAWFEAEKKSSHFKRALNELDLYIGDAQAMLEASRVMREKLLS